MSWLRKALFSSYLRRLGPCIPVVSLNLIAPGRYTSFVNCVEGLGFQSSGSPLCDIEYESKASHDARHPRFDNTCARCIFSHNASKWQRLALYKDPITGKTLTAIGERPVHLGGPWAIGCFVCSNYLSSHPDEATKKHEYADFVVRSRSAMQGPLIKRHLNGPVHKAALGALANSGSCEMPSTSTSSTSHEGVMANALPGFGGLVPRAERFIWAIGTTHTASSYNDYCTFSTLNDLTSPLSSTGTRQDMSAIACRKMVHATSAVVKASNQKFLRTAVRFAFSQDDRNQLKAMRGRMVTVKPRVEIHDITVGIMRDYGYEIQDAADATIGLLRKFCTVQSGRICTKGKWSSSQDYFDQNSFDRLSKILFCGASDGCEVEVQAIHRLRTSGVLPALRYQFRDRPHTSRTISKNSLKWAASDSSAKMRSVLITGKHSFARRVRYSKRFQQLWKDAQMEDVGNLWVVLQSLSYAEQRFDSQSEPMQRLLTLIGPVMLTLRKMSNDTARHHREDALWAKGVIDCCVGEQGWVNLVIFGLDTDFATVCYKLIAVQDRKNDDVALAAFEVKQCLERLEVDFVEGRVFDEEPNDMYTNVLLRGMKHATMIWYGHGQVAAMEWPTSPQYLRRPVEYAKRLYDVALHFFQINYPDYTWRHKFGAFHFGADSFAKNVRLAYMDDLAGKEKVDVAQARRVFASLMPIGEKLYEVLQDNKKVTMALLEEHCRERIGGNFKEAAKPFVNVALSYLGILDNSSEVERLFSRLQLLESKRRANHMTLFSLEASILVALHCPTDVDALVIKCLEPLKSAHGTTMRVLWKPRQLIVDAMRKYKEFFGVRRFTSRQLDLPKLADRAKQLASCRMKVRLSTGASVEAGNKRQPFCQRKRKWSSAQDKLVQSSRAKKAARTQNSDSSQAKSLLDAGVEALRPGRARARKELSRQLVQKKVADKLIFAREEREHGLARPPKPFRYRTIRTKAKAKPEPKIKAKAKSKSMHRIVGANAKESAPGKTLVRKLVATERVAVKPVGVYVQPGGGSKNFEQSLLTLRAPSGAPYTLIPYASKADVVVAPVATPFGVALRSTLGLHCRLFGKVLASEEYIRSRGATGPAAKFNEALSQHHKKIFLTQCAQSAFPEAVKQLRRAAAADKVHLIENVEQAKSVVCSASELSEYRSRYASKLVFKMPDFIGQLGHASMANA